MLFFWLRNPSKTLGRCFPGYERIAVTAACSRAMVAVAIRQFEAAGLLTWVHRLRRVRDADQTRVLRTSNSYAFAGDRAAILVASLATLQSGIRGKVSALNTSTAP
jgi:hypothetical protein